MDGRTALDFSSGSRLRSVDCFCLTRVLSRSSTIASTTMFARARNTFVTKTSFTLDSGVTSLVLIPLPDAQESIEDIGPQLYGSRLGSAVLGPHKKKTRIISTDSVPLSEKFDRVFSSSPLSSPPDSEEELDPTPAPTDGNIQRLAGAKVYKTGLKKTIYKINTKYMSYQSYGPEPITAPPAPPAGTNVPAHSIFSHVCDNAHSSSKLVQLWTYVLKTKTSGEETGEWKPMDRGSRQFFDSVPYQIQWRDGKNASWVKQ